MKIVHNKIRDFKCSKCSKKFGQKAGLLQHIKVVHDKIRDFQCSNCIKKFFSKAHLQWQVRTGHNIEKFKFNICAREFKTNYSLWKHIKNTHERKLLKHKADCLPPCFHFNLNKLLSKLNGQS